MSVRLPVDVPESDGWIVSTAISAQREGRMQPDRDKKEQSGLTKAGLAMSIPSLMVAGPFVGYFIGVGLQRFFGLGRGIVIVMTIAGLVAGIREAIRIIRRIS